MSNHTTLSVRRPSTIPFPVDPAPAKAAFSFAMLPAVIGSRRDLSPGAKILFAVIFSSTRRGRCYAGNDHLAACCGMSVIQVRRLLKALEGHGLIVRDLNGKTREEIRVPTACIKMIHGSDQDDASPCIEMMQAHVSKRCTELESRVENREEDLSFPPDEEFDPETLKHFGRIIARERAEKGLA